MLSLVLLLICVALRPITLFMDFPRAVPHGTLGKAFLGYFTGARQ